VKAYKFLLADRVAPFTRFRWPIGEWVEAGHQAACMDGIHACVPGDLPFWLLDELWVIELGESVARARHKLVARNGRLVGRVEAWDAGAGEDFSAACIERVRELAARRPDAAGYLSDLAAWAPHVRPAAVASLAARAFEAVESRKGYDDERAAQSAWLVGRLGLEVAA
jgi:hypothetical protein